MKGRSSAVLSSTYKICENSRFRKHSVANARISGGMGSVPGRIATIDVLRGIASFSVAWFHFTQGNPTFLPQGVLKSTGKYGWLGVQMFFVISGFVIPYALHKARYSRRQFGRFLAKRIIRLDPPYLADICLILALGYLVPLVPLFEGPQPSYTVTQLLCHLGYLNSVVGKPWINPVFWSLGIEFQYYLLMGLVFPFLVAPRRMIRFVTMIALLIPGILITRPSLIFLYMPIFLAGILTFQRKVGLLSNRLFVLGLLLCCAITWAELGVGVALIVAVATLAIAFVNLRGTILTQFGLISYSLYLVHVPIGGKVVNFGARYARGLFGEIAVLFAAAAASVAAAYLLYLAVELPSQRLSSRVSYKLA
jgi:peptidoglycan/LPS O-acetylase OafA/YrhL